MISTIPQLEDILNHYIHSAPEENEQYGRILNEWILSNNSLPLVLEVIQGCTGYNSLVSYCSYVICYLLKIRKSEFSIETLIRIFNIIFGKIQSMREIPPDNPFMRYLIIISSIITSYTKDLNIYHQIIQNMPPNILIYYFDDLIEREYGDTINGNCTPFFDNIEIFLETLTKADVCNQTFLFMTTVMKKFFKISFFSPFLPSFRYGLQEIDCSSSIVTFFEELINSTEVVNLDDDDIFFEKEMILLLIDFSKSTENTKLTSVIWSTIINQSFEFFGLELVGQEFTSFVFFEFAKILQSLVETDIDEFYVLLSYYANVFCEVPDGCEEIMVSYIENFLQFIIMLVNENPMFCNDYISVHLRMLSSFYSDKNKDFFSVDDDDDESQNRGDLDDDEKSYLADYFHKVFTGFYSKNINNLSPGFIYVFSYAPIDIVLLFASNIALQITSSEKPPITTVYFVMNCCQYAPDSIDNLLSICLANLEVTNKRDFGKALYSYVRHYPSSFIEKLNILVPVIFNILKSGISLNESQPYFVSLFTVFSKFTTNNEEVQSLFNMTGSFFLNQISEPVSNLPMLDDYINFLVSVIKSINPWQNELLRSFLCSLFDQIFNNFAPFLTDLEPIVQEDMCYFISTSLRSNWVNDRREVFEWVQDAMLMSPNDQHFTVLKELVDFLPSEKFREFLSKTGELPLDVIKAEVNFLNNLFDVNRGLVISLPIDLLLFFLSRADFLADSLDLFRKIVNCPEITIPGEDVKKILDRTLKCFFVLCNSFDLVMGFKLIKDIALKYMNLETMLNEILSLVGPLNNFNIDGFNEIFLAAPDVQFDDFKILDSCSNLIKAYRANHSD